MYKGLECQLKPPDTEVLTLGKRRAITLVTSGGLLHSFRLLVLIGGVGALGNRKTLKK